MMLAAAYLHYHECLYPYWETTIYAPDATKTELRLEPVVSPGVLFATECRQKLCEALFGKGARLLTAHQAFNGGVILIVADLSGRQSPYKIPKEFIWKRRRSHGRIRNQRRRRQS